MPNPSEIINLVPILKESRGDKFLSNLGQKVVEEFNSDKISRKTWEENTAKDIKLFTAFAEAKNYPFDNASNVILPILAIASIQFQARAYDALIPPKGVVNILDVGKQNPQRAERVGKYMNYQLLYEMEEFEEGMDKSLLQLPIVGCIFRKTYYDGIKGRVVSEYISAQDLVVAYTTRVTIEEAHRKTHVLYLYPNDIKIRVLRQQYDTIAANLGPGSLSFLNAGSDEIRRVANDAQGVQPPMMPFDVIPRIILEQHRFVDVDNDGIEEPFVVTVDYETQQVVRMTDRRYQNAFGKEVTLEYFTKYGFLPSPEGFYDVGFGTLLRGLNESANTIVNEVIDAGSLANLQGGFILKRSGLKRGHLKFKMGEYKEVDALTDDIRKALINLDFKGPNQTLYAVLGLLYEYSKLVASVSETMTGQLPASDTPATTVMALIEEGRKVFSSIHKRIHRSFKKELKKIYRLDSIFLDEGIYFSTLDDRNIPEGQEEAVGASDFVEDLDVIPVSDPNIISRAEKVLKAQQVLQNTMASPLTAGDPNAIYEATRRYYEALEVSDIDSVLPRPKPIDMSPEDENAQMMQEKPAQVLQQQDHQHHLQVHDDMANGVFGGELTPASKKLLEQHHREHMSQLYLIQANLQAQAGNARALQALAQAQQI